MHKQKILVADDEPYILKLISMMLEDTGYATIIVKDGKQAIEKALSEKPDIIITDIAMPAKDGFEVRKTLRDNPDFQNTPIIILSAIGDEFNKITGFEVGADDYITKPFNLDTLKNRIKVLSRNKAKIALKDDMSINRSLTKVSVLDKALHGGIPNGSNILLVGPLGSGKSSICRNFIVEGLTLHECNMLITLDDAPKLIRHKIQEKLDNQIDNQNLLNIVDAYSWSSGTTEKQENFAIEGILDLNKLTMIISDAGQDIGQSIQKKLGGRRVLDSISSLLVNFDLSTVQRFLAQMTRTSMTFGLVTTIFTLEEGTISSQMLNNIKYIMDGVIETKLEDNEYYLRIANMKWIDHDKEWVKFNV